MEPFIGQIMVFGGNFPPSGWAFCDGQLLSISSNNALFSLIGTIYGGDGRTTFGLPDLRSRVAVGQGQGAGLPPVNIGQKGGVEEVTLNVSQIPSHSHILNASNSVADQEDPSGKLLASRQVEIDPGSLVNSKPFTETTGIETVAMAPQSIGNTGGSRSHTNIQPSLACYYIIALVGIYPTRS